MSKQLIIIGASGHGKVIADIARSQGYTEIAFLDDDPGKKECCGFPVLGTSETAGSYKDRDFIVAIGNNRIRAEIQKDLIFHGIHVVTLIHPNAVIGSKVTIGTGTVIMAGTVIHPDTTIGAGCIVNTGATVDHDNAVDDYVHISVGSHLAGTVRVGENTMIGAGAIVSNNVNICKDCVIGAGAVVLKDIEIPGTYVGVPARKIR